jgi:hypothetical protein
MSFSLLLKVTALYFSTLRRSTTFPSTRVIMLTWMPRNVIISTEDIIPCSRNNELVNLAITQEDCILAHRAEKKRKAPAGPSNAQPPRYRLVQNAAPKALQNAPQPGCWIIWPPQQHGVARPPAPQPNGPRLNTQQPPCQSNTNQCFNCGSSTHFARDCPQSRQQA